MAVDYALTIEGGTSFRFTFIYRNKATQQPYNLTGCSAEMEVKDSLDRHLFTLSTASGQITIDGLAGRAETRMSAVETRQTKLERGRYSWFLQYPDGTRRKLFKGPIMKDE